jgi:hypothetical protein
VSKLMPAEKARLRVPCPIHGCRNKRKRDQVMCAGHWFQVPAELRNRIWVFFRDSPGSAAHLGAIREAIAVVNSKVERAAPTSPAA